MTWMSVLSAGLSAAQNVLGSLMSRERDLTRPNSCSHPPALCYAHARALAASGVEPCTIRKPGHVTPPSAPHVAWPQPISQPAGSAFTHPEACPCHHLKYMGQRDPSYPSKGFTSAQKPWWLLHQPPGAPPAPGFPLAPASLLDLSC